MMGAASHLRRRYSARLVMNALAAEELLCPITETIEVLGKHKDIQGVLFEGIVQTDTSLYLGFGAPQKNIHEERMLAQGTHQIKETKSCFY